MLIYKLFQRSAAVMLAVIGLASLVGCKKEFTTLSPVGTGSEKTLFQSYVAIGTSIDAGYQSGSLFKSGQQHSFPVLLAQQAGVTDFQIPLVDQNGIGNRLVFKGLSNGLPIIAVNPTIGSPLNLSLPRAYNNLGVPGAIAADFFDSSAVNSATRRNNPYFGLILRNQAFGKSLAAQMASLSPSLVSVWYGPNEVLGYATSGGLQSLLYSANASIGYPGFAVVYPLVINTIKATAPNAKIIVATVPDVTSIPFTTTVGPVLKAGLASVGLPRLYYHKSLVSGGTLITPFVLDSVATANIGDPTKNLILLTAKTAAGAIGDTSGNAVLNDWKVLLKGAIPTTDTSNILIVKGTLAAIGVDLSKPLGIDRRNPFPNTYVLDSTEIANTKAALAAVNNTITAQANAANGVYLVDVNSIFNTIATTGKVVDGTTFTAAYLSGNTFSLDGVHPSSKADGILANAFIDVINSKLGTNIPKVNTSTLSNGITLP